jgi:hypothetical protein
MATQQRIVYGGAETSHSSLKVAFNYQVLWLHDWCVGHHGSVQGCQVAVVTAPLLKSGRRKSLGAVRGREGAVEGSKRLKRGRGIKAFKGRHTVSLAQIMET